MRSQAEAWEQAGNFRLFPSAWLLPALLVPKLRLGNPLAHGSSGFPPIACPDTTDQNSSSKRTKHADILLNGIREAGASLVSAFPNRSLGTRGEWKHALSSHAVFVRHDRSAPGDGGDSPLRLPRELPAPPSPGAPLPSQLTGLRCSLT